MKKTAYLLIPALLCLYVLYLFLDFAEDTRGYKSAGTGSDALVVLTGGKGRAEEGLSLLRKGGSNVLILSGVHADANLDAIYLNKLKKDERYSIVLEKTSKSTYENAIEVRRLLKDRGLKSMVLITSGYHMKRADYIFRRVMPPEITIKTYSVASPNFDNDRWWSGTGPALLGIEFLKYYWYVLKFAFSGPGIFFLFRGF